MYILSNTLPPEVTLTDPSGIFIAFKEFQILRLIYIVKQLKLFNSAICCAAYCVESYQASKQYKLATS